MIFTAFRRMAVTAACTALSGCAVVVILNMEQEQRAALFLVPPDKAVIYFFRDEANNDALPLALSVDGNAVGETLPTRFLFYEVEPGHHVLVSAGAPSDSIALDTEAGKMYFVGQEVGCDATHLRLHLHTVDPAAGRARVQALYRASKTETQDGALAAANSATCPSAIQNAGGTHL